jgi:hypothetical protein
MGFECSVLQDNAFGLHDEIGMHRGVSLQCFVDDRMLFAMIIQEAAEDRYGGQKLTREEANRLVDSDREAIGALIAKKYRLGEVTRLHPVGRSAYPLILITMDDVARRMAPLENGLER